MPFTGKAVGPIFERSPVQQREEGRALRDARLIREVRQEEGDTWQTVAFLALVKALDPRQQRTLEALLSVRAIAGDDEAAEKAAAVVRMATGSPEHCGRVASMLVRMNGGAW